MKERDVKVLLARHERAFVFVFAAIVATASAGLVAASAPPMALPQVRTIKIVERVMVTGPATVIDLPIAPATSDIVRAKLLAEHRCLAEVMYYEARGEGEKGERAVAEVVFHRMNNGFGRSICAVVYEGANRPGCQFSFACDGSRERPKSIDDWRFADALAARILTGEQPLDDATLGAVNYHAIYVRPIWSEEMVRTAQIGNHIFYRLPGHDLRQDRTAMRGSLL